MPFMSVINFLFKTYAEKTTKRTVPHFEKDAKLSFDAVSRLVTADLPEPDTKTMFRNWCQPWLYNVKFENGMFGFSLEYDFSDRIIQEVDIEKKKGERGSLRRLFAGAVASGIAIDFKQMNFVACRMMGGWIWARAGAYVRDTDKDDLSEYVQARLQVIRPYISETDFDQAMTYARFENPKDLHDLACLPLRLDKVPSIAQLFDDMHAEEYTGIENEAFDDYRKMGFFKDGAITLGQFSLAGLQYDAYVDFKDDAQLQRIEDYTHVPIRQQAMEARMKGIIQPTQYVRHSSTPGFQTAHRP
jgi:hypothetical protein